MAAAFILHAACSVLIKCNNYTVQKAADIRGLFFNTEDYVKYNDTLSGKYTRVPVYRELRINSFDFMSLVKAMDRRGYCIFLESAGA